MSLIENEADLAEDEELKDFENNIIAHHVLEQYDIGIQIASCGHPVVHFMGIDYSIEMTCDLVGHIETDKDEPERLAEWRSTLTKAIAKVDELLLDRPQGSS